MGARDLVRVYGVADHLFGILAAVVDVAVGQQHGFDGVEGAESAGLDLHAFHYRPFSEDCKPRALVFSKSAERSESNAY